MYVTTKAGPYRRGPKPENSNNLPDGFRLHGFEQDAMEDCVVGLFILFFFTAVHICIIFRSCHNGYLESHVWSQQRSLYKLVCCSSYHCDTRHLHQGQSLIYIKDIYVKENETYIT